MPVPFSPPLSPAREAVACPPSNATRADEARLLFLRAARLMAVGGVNDARAAALMLGWFGRNYRRPLVLMRAMMLELARVSQRRIQLGPPCCTRMTRDEALMLRALGREERQIGDVHDDACELLALDNALGAATCFQAVATCFADLGAPFSRTI